MSTTVVVPRQPEITQPQRRIPAIVAAVVLLALATTLANRVLPGWAYPVCGTVTAIFLIMLAHWSGVEPHTIGLDRRHFRRAALVGLLGLALVAVRSAPHWQCPHCGRSFTTVESARPESQICCGSR
jgi:hypothetical protein